VQQSAANVAAAAAATTTTIVTGNALRRCFVQYNIACCKVNFVHLFGCC